MNENENENENVEATPQALLATRCPVCGKRIRGLGDERRFCSPEHADLYDQHARGRSAPGSFAPEKLPARIARAGIDELEARLASATRRADSMAQAMQAIMLACDEVDDAQDVAQFDTSIYELAVTTRKAVDAYLERERAATSETEPNDGR